jgi:hypothetical protein
MTVGSCNRRCGIPYSFVGGENHRPKTSAALDFVRTALFFKTRKCIKPKIVNTDDTTNRTGRAAQQQHLLVLFPLMVRNSDAGSEGTFEGSTTFLKTCNGRGLQAAGLTDSSISLHSQGAVAVAAAMDQWSYHPAIIISCASS